MSKFGLQTQGSVNDYSAPQSFNAVVDETIGRFVANGIAEDNSIGVAIRTESRDSGAAAVLDSAWGAASGAATAISSSLNFAAAPGNCDTPSGSSHGAGFFSDGRLESLRMRAETAAKMGYMMAVGFREHNDRELTVTTPRSGGTVVNQSALSGGNRSTLRQEAFNNIDLRRSVAFSMGYNAAVTRQTDVVMAWFPPIFINPDQTTMEIQISPLTVFNGALHNLNGDKTDFERREVARAFADGSILGRHETQLIPVARAQNSDKLVDTAEIDNFELTVGRRSLETNFIKFDTDVNLLSLCATDAILSSGPQNHRDTIEPGAKLWRIAAKSASDIIELNILDLKTTNFIGAQQGDQYEMSLNMRLNLGLGKALTRRDGSALTGPLKALVDNDYRANIALSGGGNINTETGNGRVATPKAQLVSLVNAVTGEEVTGAALTTLQNAVAAMTFLGFIPKAYRTNANRRQQGDRLNTRRFNYHFIVPYRDPITAERPAHRQEDHDAQDLTNLLALTRIRLENEVIDKIVETDAQLASFVDVRTNDVEKSDIVGLAQFFLLATYHYKNLDMKLELDSRTSGDRPRDIQSVLTMYIRDISSRLYTESQWKAGTDVQSGGTMPNPQLNILTDPIIARYLLEPGDLRTAGDFEFVVTTTLNYQVRGKIFMSFRIPGQEASNEPNIFNFGHLLMSPELVLAANMTREGSYFAETQVQPRYELVVMCPVLARIDVRNIREVLSKVPAQVQLVGNNDLNPIFMSNVTPPVTPPVTP